jgi:hypothetical protein
MDFAGNVFHIIRYSPGNVKRKTEKRKSGGALKKSGSVFEKIAVSYVEINAFPRDRHTGVSYAG